jgi:tektin-3
MSDWKPSVGYENIDVMPLSAHPTTNQLVQPCYVPNMSTEPINFPNLVTGFEVKF